MARRFTALPRVGWTAQPWANGRGVTHEIAADRSALAAPFKYRLSVADLRQPGGAFSQIVGVDRLFTLLSGNGVSLSVGGAPAAAVGVLEPFAFAGDVSVTSAVEGDARPLNLMWDRARCTADVTVFCNGFDLASLDIPAAMTLVLALDDVRLSVPGQEPDLVVPAGDAAMVTAGSGACSGRCVVARVFDRLP